MMNNIDPTHWNNVGNIFNSKKMQIGIDINDKNILMKKARLLLRVKTKTLIIKQKTLMVYHPKKMRKQPKYTWKTSKQAPSRYNRGSKKECRPGYFQTSLNISNSFALKLIKKLIYNFKLSRRTTSLNSTKDLRI